MPEYIERDVALNRIENMKRPGKSLVILYLQELPAADVEPVVHCVDCKHLYFKDMSAYCPYMVGRCLPDGFCSRGEWRVEAAKNGGGQ